MLSRSSGVYRRETRITSDTCILFLIEERAQRGKTTVCNKAKWEPGCYPLLLRWFFGSVICKSCGLSLGKMIPSLIESMESWLVSCTGDIFSMIVWCLLQQILWVMEPGSPRLVPRLHYLQAVWLLQKTSLPRGIVCEEVIVFPVFIDNVKVKSD